MRVAALVVTYNRKELLAECLAALQQQTYPLNHILVINNASTDGTAEMLTSSFPDVEVRTMPENLGGAAGFRKGLEWAMELDVDWVWAMDDDTIPDPNSLKSLLEASRERNYAALGSTVVWTDGRLHPMNHPWPDLRRPFLRSNYGRLVHWLSFVSVLIPKSTLQEYGLPNARFFVWNDDIEYFTRVSRKYPLLQVKESYVVHKSKSSYTPAHGNPLRYYYQARNRIWLSRSPHLTLAERILFMLHFSGEALVFLAKNPLRGWSPLLRGIRDGLIQSPYG